MSEVTDAAKTIQDHRKNPMLILDLKEVRKSDLLNMHKLLHGKKFNTLDVVLQTPGGDIDAAFLYAKLLKGCCTNLNIIIPLYAKSAGTLICLIADKILMTELSELGPLDTQIRESQDGDSPEYNSALNGFKALEQIQQHNISTLDLVTKLILGRYEMKMSEAIHLSSEFSGQTSGNLYKHLNPTKIGEYARALEIGEYYGKMILTRYRNWNERDAANIINLLVYKYPSHGFAIDCQELQKLGLPAEFVESETASKLFTLREKLLQSKKTSIELIEYETKGTKPSKGLKTSTKKISAGAIKHEKHNGSVSVLK